MARHPEWPARLRAAIEDARHKPHAWGTHDCALFAGVTWFEAVTGRESPAAHLVGTYDDAAGARAAIAALGAEDLIGAVGLFLPRRPNCFLAWRGDIGVVMHDGEQIVVGIGNPYCLAPGARGLHHIPRSKLIAAFEVG